MGNLFLCVLVYFMRSKTKLNKISLLSTRTRGGIEEARNAKEKGVEGGVT